MPRRILPTQLAAGILLFAGLLLTACGPPIAMRPDVATPSVENALELTKSGRHEAAAALFERLAIGATPPVALSRGLSAVREWLTADRVADAQRVFAALPPASVDATQAEERRLVEIDLLLARKLPAEAWRLASRLPEPRSPRVLQSVQRAALAVGRSADAVQASLALEKSLPGEPEREAARAALLASLRDAATRGVKLEPQTARDPLVRGWLEIGQIASTAAHSPLGVSRELVRWRKKYPVHPATSIAMAELNGPASGPVTMTTLSSGPVALLLPLTGRQAVAGALVRDGFLSALTVLPESQRPLVKVYDTGDPGLANALRAAQADNAGFVVGPLTRENTVQAVAGTLRRAPLLLLNALPNDMPTPMNTWQFALSPEDEAQQVARRALAQNQKRALVFAPTGDWGNRVTTAFRDAFMAGGGVLLDVQAYDAASNDFMPHITAALRIDESRARHKRLEGQVGKLQFEPRRRADVDLIFAAGQSVALRQIRAQLRFYYAGDVPTYMTSDGFDPDPAANVDLEGVQFPDMPWMLQEVGPVADARAATQAGWADKGLRLPRLFAFGYDAAQLMLALTSPRWQWPLSGVTGRLSPDSQGRIRRELDWAQLRKGKPQIYTAP
ncbi:MAG: hypothetical protein RLZZ200_2972 [Pseudomonadota bacterium]